MRNMKIKKQFYVDEEIEKIIKINASKVGLNEASYFRMLVKNYEPKEKPDREFYEELKKLRSIGNNLNQIASKANSLNYIDVPFYKRQVEELNNFILSMKKKYLLPNTKSSQ